AVSVHVSRGDEAEHGGGRAEAERRLELPGDGRVPPRADADLRAARLAVRDDGYVAEAVVEGGHRMADHDDERAAADGGAVDVARHDAEGLANRGGGVLTGREDAVDVRDLQPGVAHGVGDGLDVQGELALVRQRAHLVRLVHADDTGDVRQIAQVRHGAHRPAGWNSGSVTSSVSFENTTSTGISHFSVRGSASTLIRLDSIRGPSASSIMASTYGGGTLKALLND